MIGVSRDDDGVSPVVAVVLLVAVTILLSAIVFGAVSDLTPDGDGNSADVAARMTERADGVHITLIASESPVDVVRNGEVLHTFNASDVGTEVVVGNLSAGDEVSLVTNASNPTVLQSHSVEAAVGGSDLTVDSTNEVSEPTTTTQAQTLSWSLGSDGGTASRAVVQRSSHVRLGYKATGANLASYWALDGALGSVVDRTGNGNDGTNYGASRGVSGVLGTNAFSFASAEGDHVPFTATSAIPAGNDQYAIATWFKASSGDCSCGIIGWGDYGTANEVTALRLRGSGGASDVSLRHYWWSNDLDADTTTPYGGNWHFVVAQFDGTTREIWLDGTRVSSDTPTGHAATRNNAAIGVTNFNNNNEYWNGKLDEIRVYDRALSDSDIAFLSSGVKSGTYTTTWQTTTDAHEPSNLTLTNVSASLNGQTATVYVESDADGDGTVDETSDAITLTSSTDYTVTGLTQSSDRFRLRVELSTSTITATPTVSSIDLKAE